MLVLAILAKEHNSPIMQTIIFIGLSKSIAI